MLFFALIALLIEIILLWNWLKVIETTSGPITPNMSLKELKWSDKLFHTFWIIGFLMLPVFSKLSKSPESENYGLFFTNLIFGKFFWDALLPSFETDDSFKDNLKLYAWGPIANLISGILVIKLLSWIFGGLYLIGPDTKASMNFAMNALANLWPPYISESVGNSYEFPIGFSALAILVIFIRVFTLRLHFLSKALLTIGIFCLLNRCLKYSGNDFNQIMSLSFDSLKQEYSISNFVTIFLGWFISLILKPRNA
jgi:hypothetical protein